MIAAQSIGDARPQRFLPDRSADTGSGKLGEGGMGIVYEAVDDRLGRPLALKSSARDHRQLGRAANVLAEARPRREINHRISARSTKSARPDDQLFLAMEGRRRAAVGASGSRRGSTCRAVRIGMEALGALDALHSCGVVHRDLKPSNIFLTRHGVKLLDFGLARPFVDAVSETNRPLTQPGLIVGTPKYMAPEQLQGGLIDARTDIFAAAVILYEMWRATRPRSEHVAHDGGQVLQKIHRVGGSRHRTADL